MQYYKSGRPKGGRSGIVIAIACCLIAGGAFIWQLTAKKISKTEIPEINLPDPSAYSGSDPSYTDSEPTDPVTSDVTEPLSDVPYPSEPAPEKEPEPERLVLPIDGKILKHFDEKALQYSATFNDLRLHLGTDIAATAGQTVVPAGAGTVTATEESAALGKTVTVDHGNGIVLKYCGLDKIEVAKGDRVIAGQTLGMIGNIPGECADAPHLHLEATENGKAISPEELF